MEDLIFSALLNQSKFEQEQAQAKIVQLRSSNPEYYLTECASITHNQNNSDQLRQAAGTLLAAAALLTIKRDGVQFSYWDYLSNDKKESIKIKLLQTLVSKSELAKRSAASAIASICSVEVVRGEWPTLIPSLVNIINGNDPQAMATAVMTLGFISAQFIKVNKKLLPHQSQQILVGIMFGLKIASQNNNISVRKTSLSALRDSLNFVTDLLQSDKARDFIFTTIIDNLKHPDTTEISIQALEEFCKHGYNHLKSYIPEILKHLAEIIQQGNSSSIAAIQVWNIIGQEHLERAKNPKSSSNNTNYLLLVHQPLSELLMQQTIKPSEDGQLKNSAINALTTLVSACGEISFDKVTNFISNTINNPDENIRQVSVLAFSALTEAQQEEKVLKFFDVALDLFVKLLSDSSKIVVESTLAGFERIFYKPSFARAFLSKTSSQQYIGHFIEHINNPFYEIKHLAFSALIQLFDHLAPQNSTDSDNLIHSLLQTLTNYVFECGVDSLIDSAFTCICKILIKNKKPEISYYYVTFIIEKLQKLPNNNMRIIDGCMELISVGIKRMTSVQSNLQFMNKMFSFVVSYFTALGSVHENGLEIIGALSYAYKKQFQVHLQQAEKYLTIGLNSYKDKALYKAALFCLQDISTNIGGYIKRNFKKFMDLLIQGMSADIDPELKILVLDAIGDCISAVGNEAEPYIPSLINTIQVCFQAALYNDDDRQKVQQLRACIIRLENSIFFTVNDQDYVNPLVKQHFPKLLDFIFRTTSRDQNPTVSYLRECVELAYYSADLYKMKHLINTEEFKIKVDVLEGFVEGQDHLKEALMGIKRGLSCPY